MSRRLYKTCLLFMTFLFAVSCLVPSAGQAEVLMRCAGALPSSPPCAHAEMPAAGLTPQKSYDTLMACCRKGNRGCTMRPACPMSAVRRVAVTTPGSRVSARRCLVTVRITQAAPAQSAVQRPRWLLTFAPSLAPPSAVTPIVEPAATAGLSLWTYLPGSSLHTLPSLHGLRAPPSA